MPKSNIKFVFGFPVRVEDQTNHSTVEPSAQKKGISLIIAMMTVAMMMGMVADLIISSSVNIEVGIASRDKVKSEYLAKSGMNLATFLLSASWGIDLFRASDLAGPAKAKPNDSDASMWNSFNQLPPMGAASVELVSSAAKTEGDPFGLQGIFSEKISKQMAQFEDYFSIKIEDESSKINLSLCQKETKCPIAQLQALFSCPAEKAFLDKKNITPEELAYRVYDFISSSNRSSLQSGLNGKDDTYLSYKPPYKTKRLPLDTLDELKLVEGWDDDVHAVFSPYITVWPYFESSIKQKSQININTAKIELLRCLIPSTQKESNSESFAVGMEKIKNDKTAVVEDEKQIAEVLKTRFGYSGGEEDSSLDRTQWFTNNSRTFRVNIEAVTGNQELALTMVLRRIEPKDESFLRGKQQQKRSYQILYYRLQ